jgi:flagellar biosynthesis/type III secretory pathway chaperone
MKAKTRGAGATKARPATATRIRPVRTAAAPAAAAQDPADDAKVRMDAERLLGFLESLLAAQVDAARTLRAALMAEHAALEQRDAASLTLAAADKARAVQGLDHAERNRRALCTRIGAGPGQPELTAWLDAFQDGSDIARRLRERSAELATLLRECRAAHDANSMVVAMLHRRVELALDLLGDRKPTPGQGRPVIPGQMQHNPCPV